MNLELLEIGPGRHPSMMAGNPEVNYRAVDKSPIVHELGLEVYIGDIRHFAASGEAAVDRFDLIYAANVLGNLPGGDQERYSVVSCALGLLNSDGRLVLIEYLSPPRAKLTTIQKRFGGIIYSEADGKFMETWSEHIEETSASKKQRLNLKKPFQMLEI